MVSPAPARKTAVLERTMVFGDQGETADTVVWCLHCGQEYRLGDARLVGDLWLCATPDCSGDVIFDAKDRDFGEKFRAMNASPSPNPTM